MGRYFYGFPEIWVDLDRSGRPRQVPDIPKWARRQDEWKAANSALKLARTIKRIESFSTSLGRPLYESILAATGGSVSAQEIVQPMIQQKVLRWLESAHRGLSRARKIAAQMSEPELGESLGRLGIQSLEEIPDIHVLVDLVKEMESAQASRKVA